MRSKAKLLFSLVLVLLFLVSTTAVAKAPNDNNGFKLGKDELFVFEANEIVDQELLLDRAKKGITDVPAYPLPKVELIRDDGQKVDSNKIEKYVTVQRVKTKKNIKTGATTDLYRVDSFAAITPTALSDTNQKWDSSYSVLSTNTGWYEVIRCNTFGGLQYFAKYTKVQGKWDKSDGQVTMTNGRLGYYHQGADTRNNSCSSLGSHYGGKEKNIGNPTSGTTYSYIPDPAIDRYYATFSVADFNCSNTKVTLTRGTTTWEFLHQNLLDIN